MALGMLVLYHQQIQTKMSQAQKLFTSVKSIIEENGQSELVHKAFLKPFEVALKTWRTEDQPDKIGCLPYGLKQVLKKDIDSNQYQLKDFQEIDENFINQRDSQFSFLEENDTNNLISILKPNSGNPQAYGLKVAICICMYSQDKSMLRKTLGGVGKNIAAFNQRGIPSHQIGVFVIMDGIEVVDSSVVDYFQILQKQNNIYLEEDIEPTNPQQILERRIEFQQDKEIMNINKFLFSENEEKDRKNRRFVERKKQYKNVKQMIKKIEAMEKDKTLTYDALDEYVKPFFIEKAREKHKKDYGEDDEENKKKKDDYFIENYAFNLKVSRPLIQDALSQAKRHCKEYIETRDDLALVSPFRYEINALNGVRGRQSSGMQRERDAPFMNLFMVTKYKNRGKLSSHNWFFNGFCQQLKPEFAVLLDVGLSPEADALVKMIDNMEKNEKVGGVCGYMGLKIQKVQEDEEVSQDSIDCVTSFCMNFFDIQRAQQLEYHFAHLIDKPFESMFKFIHVLPGAFSAYRIKALRPDDKEQSELLKKYFASIDETVSQEGYEVVNYTNFQGILKVILPDFFFCQTLPQKSDEKLLYNQNVYLAEDRTLCMGIHQNNYDLTYLPDAYAWVDPIKTLYGLLGQRKRWINGSFFAFQAVRETMSSMQKCEPFLWLQVRYLMIMNMLAYIAPALFLFTIHIAMQAFQSDVIIPTLFDLGIVKSKEMTPINQIFVYLIDFLYVMVFLGLVFFSTHLTNRHPKFKPFIYGSSTLYGIFSLIIIVVFTYDIVRGFLGDDSYMTNNQQYVSQVDGGMNTINALRYIILAIFGLYAFPILISILAFQRCDFVIDILLSTPAFIFYSPTYLMILNVYALCRIDDISWGTKGLDSDAGGKTKSLQDNWKKIKFLHVSKFVFYNSIFGFVFIMLADTYILRFILTFVIMVILGLTLFLKVFLGLIYIIQYRCGSCCKKEQQQVDVGDDKVQKVFENVKKSLYKNIENGIGEMNQQCQEKKMNINEIIISGASMINKMAFRKKQNEKYTNSIIQKSGILRSQSFRAQNSIKNTLNKRNTYKKLEPISQSPQKAHNSNKKVDNSADNLMDNSVNSDGNRKLISPIKPKDIVPEIKEQVHIQVEEEEENMEQKKKNKPKFKKQHTALK